MVLWLWWAQDLSSGKGRLRQPSGDLADVRAGLCSAEKATGCAAHCKGQGEGSAQKQTSGKTPLHPQFPNAESNICGAPASVPGQHASTSGMDPALVPGLQSSWTMNASCSHVPCLREGELCRTSSRSFRGEPSLCYCLNTWERRKGAFQRQRNHDPEMGEAKSLQVHTLRHNGSQTHKA